MKGPGCHGARVSGCRCQGARVRGAAAWCLVLLLVPTAAGAQVTVRKTVSLLGGAVTGLVVHESGHVMTSALFGAHPDTKPIHYAGILFFAVTHTPVTRRQEFVVSSAGFWMQDIGSEWLLTARPHLSDQSAPFLKGVLAFNLATSVMYAGAAFGKLGPPERDPLGMARSLGKNGWPEPAVGALILAPALLDGYRYLKPEQKWAAWASRGVKTAFIALTLFAGRPLP